MTVAPAAEVCSTTKSAGWGRVGGVVSWTRIVKVTWLLLPAASVAVQVTVVDPAGSTEPLGGVQTTLGLASAASVAAGSA